ncbi:hypothetical protein [Carnimonas bestiolae]|uniref:hypothetical protein n=1 Tax=Carnimonas bestiolae TaxID=3402172 RepID=UPI003EDB8CD6
MILLVCALLAFALFIGAAIESVGIVREVNKNALQRRDDELVHRGWKAAGLVLCGVIIIVAGMLLG